MSDPEQCSIIVAPGLEPMIRELAVQMFGEESRNESLGELISHLLPLLIPNALAGDYVPPATDVPLPEEGGVDIKTAVEAASQAVEDTDVSVPLEVSPNQDEEERVEEEPPQITVEEMEESGVSSKALQWARGNPLKEKALSDTLLQMPRSMWEWDKVLELSERIYNARGGANE